MEEALLREVERLSLRRALLVVSTLTRFSGPALIAGDIAAILRAAGVEVVVAARRVSGAMEEAVPALRGAVALHQDPRPIMAREFDLVLTQAWPPAAFALLECGVRVRHLVCGAFSATAPGETLAGLAPLADALLFGSAWMARMQEAGLGPAPPPMVSYRNALPRAWFEDPPPAPAAVRRVGIITNHPVPALEEMQAALTAKGMEVRRIGRGGAAEMVDAAAIARHDAIITIGHTAQKALARMRPVFVCGPLGAPGWVTPANLSAGEDTHFCGAGGPRPDAAALAGAFLAGAADACRDAPALHATAAARMVAEERLAALLRALPCRDMPRGFGGAAHWPLRRLAQMVTAADPACAFFPEGYMSRPPAEPDLRMVSAVPVANAATHDMPALSVVPFALAANGIRQPRARFRLRRMGRWPDTRFALEGAAPGPVALAARTGVAQTRARPHADITTFDVTVDAQLPAAAGEMVVTMQAAGADGDVAPIPVLRLVLAP